MSALAAQEASQENVISLPSKKGSDSRKNEENKPSPAYPDASQALILAKFDKQACKLATCKEKEKAKARTLTVKILSKKKTIELLISELNRQQIPFQPIVVGLSRIAQEIEPSEVITTPRLIEISAIEHEAISPKWLKDKFPLIVDLVGFTTKETQTERRFSELHALQNQCNILAKSAYVIGDCIYNGLDHLAGSIMRSNPYVERTNKGELIKHERPQDTKKGKEAKRKADLALYLKQQQQIEKGSTNHDTFDLSHLASYKWHAIIGIGVVAILMITATIQEEKPAVEIKQQQEIQEVTSEMIAADIAADAGY